jgi:hypothetical protein
MAKTHITEFELSGMSGICRECREYNISDRTARRDLSELTEKELNKNKGDNKLSRYHFP